jgi:hypothetical protein
MVNLEYKAKIEPLLAWYAVHGPIEDALHDLTVDVFHMAACDGLDVTSMARSALATWEAEDSKLQ